MPIHRSVRGSRSRYGRVAIRFGLAALLLQGPVQASLPQDAHAAAPRSTQQANAAAFGKKTAQPISLMRKDGESERSADLKLPILSEEGRMYLSFQDVRGVFGEISLTKKGKQILLAYPGVLAAFTPNSREAMINGRAVRSDAASLIVRRNAVYLSIREVASLLHAGISYASKERKLTIDYSERYLAQVDPGAQDAVWMNRATKQVYTAASGQLPVLAGISGASLEGYGEMETERLDAQNLAITVTDSYGEPSLGTNVIKWIVHKGKLALESKAAYYGVRRTDSLFRYEGGLVLVDGGRVLLASPDGKVNQAADIEKLLDPRDAITVVYAADDALIVRLYQNQMLALVNLQTKKAAMLYKQLLPEDDQKRIQESSRYAMDFDYDGDGLEFDKREGDVFYFTHAASVGTGESVLRYSLRELD
ncbi:stalk domain-containing protein [Paenibacillus sacheonensis]|uniref:Copper amine oxidase-like N-terminal domain-containing protein n=1 Tax=Paenibacillus sacheonensis TaxID=742054 RepID=A0A7X4YSG8_9BACL|nr:stalk domain-containing protein [Paenibacillus sacheonensis]MBM7566726.1 hypothetical protein [Paenibacillus sacheonensis]NBC71698.1 hypothetical protein [Paenibacillus sacheonensis]